MSFEKPWGNYLLEAMVETKAPDTISFWPQTIAWKLIVVWLTIFIVKKTYRTWKNYQANAYRREALAWLAQCSLLNEEHIRQLPTLLRKTAILAANRQLQVSNSAFTVKHKQEITKLRGESWTIWLDQHCSKSNFNGTNLQPNINLYSCERLLAQLAYIATIDLNNAPFREGLIELNQQIELWIKFHELTIEPQQTALEETT